MRRMPLPLLLLYGLTGGGGDSTQLPRPGRTPRQIQLTEGATARGELVLWMPLTVVLPSLTSRSHSTSPARSQRHLDSEQYDGVAQVPSERTSYDWAAPEYRTAGRVGPLLSRVDAYFHYLRVPSDHCRQRTICQLAQQVEEFEPVSGLVMRALRKSDSSRRLPSDGPAERRFSQYRSAAELGATGADCGRTYSSCPTDARQLINMAALRLWQLLAELAPLHITDD